MYSQLRNLMLYSFVSIYVISFLGNFPVCAKESEPNEIIAQVNGVKIFYNEVKIDSTILKSIHKEQFSEQQLANKVKQEETRRLIGKIHEIIFMQKVNEYGLIADDSEINKKIDENFNKAGMTTDKAKSLCDNFRIIYEALIELHKDPSKVDDIYSKRLENIISKDQWKLFQICYNTPEKLKNFLIPKDIDDMKKNSYESTVKDVLYEKLESIITKNIDVTDDEITEAYHKIYDQLAEKPKLEDMKQKLHNDLILKKEQEAKMLWWQEQYKQANIKIIDSQFRGAQNLLYSTIKMQDNNHDEKNEE